MVIYISILKGRVAVATTNRSENRVRYVESLQAIDRFVQQKVATVARQKQVIDLYVSWNILREDITTL
jgi:hypothetical protein